MSARRATRAAGGREAESRRKLIGAVHAESKKRGLVDSDYRKLVMEASAGRTRSSADLSVQELGLLLDRITGRQTRPIERRRRLADSAHARKIRALWLALWNLGVIDDPSDEALAVFALRQTGVGALQWIRPDQAYAVIEALKAICRRADFDPPGDGIEARWALLAAQQRAMAHLMGVPARLPEVDDSVPADQLAASLDARIRERGEQLREMLIVARGPAK